MTIDKTINIIGGGISGLTTSLAFKTNGINHNLYEKNSEITYENVGFGISANIFPILDEWNILNQTKEIGAEIQKFHFVDHDLKYLNSFQIMRPPLSIKRNLFHKLLAEKINKIEVNHPKKITDFTENQIVICADGLNSESRQEIYPNLKLRSSNQILLRGISQIKIDEKFKNAYHSFVGNNLRFAIIHTGEDFYSWYAIKENNPNEDVFFDKANLNKSFKKYHPIVNHIIESSENIYFSELKDINPNDRKNLNWYRNNALLIGDAIHPTTPNMANGGCLAMEDAYLLAKLFGEMQTKNVQEIFKVFQKSREKKVDNVVYQSYWFGKLLHQENKTIENLIKLGIKLTPKFLFDKIYSNVLTEIKVRK